MNALNPFACFHRIGFGRLLLCLIILIPYTATLQAQQKRTDLPKIVSEHGKQALLVDGKPYFIFGAQAHNSSAWPDMLPSVWRDLDSLHANTLELPVYWEQMEPSRGHFDFSIVDTLILQAAAHDKRLILLWFATWKNGSNHYMPAWMKRDANLYPNLIGKNGKPVDSPSPHAEATVKADAKAFAALMKHLRETDLLQRVIMVQVENETGAWGSVRDYSLAAQKLFEGEVPAALLRPELLKELQVPVVASGSWQKVFGERADEYFQAWAVARFVNEVAAAGKAAYPLPLYVNAALRDPFSHPMANNYESGGPTDNVIPIWKVAAPAVDLLAPDIYLSGSKTIMKVLDLYHRPDNPLFVPELGWNRERVKYLYEILARGGIGFSPFGLDDNGLESTPSEISEKLLPYASEYAVFAPLHRQMAAWAFEGKIKAALEREDHADQIVDLGNWQAIVSFGKGERNVSDIKNADSDGKLLIVQLGDDRFILIGTLCRVSFLPAGQDKGRAWQYLKVEEGHYGQDIFKARRILNGDETDWGGPRFGSRPVILQAELVLR